MALTKRSDLVIPEILVDAVQGEFEGQNVLVGSGVAVMSNTLPMDKRGGDTVTVPYFGTLGEMEDIVNEGDALTPESISMDADTATVRHSGKAFEITEWARMASLGDPYAEAGRQFRVINTRRVDKALIEVANTGVPAEFTLDVSGIGSGKIDIDVIIDATGLWGDQQDAIRLLAMHSKLYRDLMKLKDSTGKQLMTTPTRAEPIPMFNGIPVVVSDKMKTFNDGAQKYEMLLMKEAALAYWWQAPPKVVTDYDALADTDLIAMHTYWAAHRYRRVRGSTKPGVIKITTK
jgi:HK97 family phage major capsid protein